MRLALSSGRVGRLILFDCRVVGRGKVMVSFFFYSYFHYSCQGTKSVFFSPSFEGGCDARVDGMVYSMNYLGFEREVGWGGGHRLRGVWRYSLYLL